MVAAARIAAHRSIMARADADRLERLVAAFGLPTRVPARLADRDIIALTKTDKKVAAGRVRFVFVPRFGETVIRDDITDDDIRAVLAEIRGTA
jgi:3-dehydroquinate synthase